jgi:AraC family transcriptional regulator, regulatory protein of adaptative response / methylated-DNA-[protein]-cysteine methyltransferase
MRLPMQSVSMTVKKLNCVDEGIQDPRWRSVINRDVTAEGKFFYSVKTTGVFCRPSCAARRPNPKNVGFYSTAEEARKAGFRPCQRCRPDQPPLEVQHASLVATACHSIDSSESCPSLSDLATNAGLSLSHFHRMFKTATGLTPKQYAAASRARRVRAKLRGSPTITDAIYDAGYNSNGRFYAASNQLLGMAPSTFRTGGNGVQIRFAIGQCSLGAILVAQSERGICAILLGEDPLQLLHDLEKEFPRAQLATGDTHFEQLVAQVVAFVEAPGAGLALPLDIRGTAFQQRVWEALRRIPVGSTGSYTSIAKEIGAPTSVRAVAGACAANRLAVAVPCHRVVRLDGNLSGYRWGVERKNALLASEAKGKHAEPVNGPGPRQLNR